MVRYKTISPKTIRAENRKKILQLLIKKRELTILEISRELKISIPTVTKNIEQLIDEGIAEKAGVSSSTVGRKPMVIRFVPDAYYSFGVEFSMEYVRIILTNFDAAIKADKTLRNINYNDIDGLMIDIHREVNGILQEKEVPTPKVLGIGFALPGIVNEETRFLKLAPNLRIKNLDFRKYETSFDFPLIVENEANAAAMAELRLGIAKEMRNLVYVSILPKGVGTGIVVGGHLYKGENERAGEYGHTTIASHGKPCSCGRKDCWEAYASGNVLMEEYEKKTGKHLEGINAFFVALKSNDLAAAEIFDEYIKYLAVGIQDIILVQDPHYVIVGGVISPFEEDFLEPLKEKIFVENNFYDSNDVKIMCSTLKEDASILGVSLLSFEEVFFGAIS